MKFSIFCVRNLLLAITLLGAASLVPVTHAQTSIIAPNDYGVIEHYDWSWRESRDQVFSSLSNSLPGCCNFGVQRSDAAYTSTVLDMRAIVEFSMAGLVAGNNYYLILSPFGQYGGNGWPPALNIRAFNGNGIVQVDDFSAGSLLGSVPVTSLALLESSRNTPDAYGGYQPDMRIDISDLVSTSLQNGNSYLGFSLQAELASNHSVFSFDPTGVNFRTPYSVGANGAYILTSAQPIGGLIAITPSIPEPSQLALLVAGLALIGYKTHRGRLRLTTQPPK
jgi:hypothetical protein